MNLFWKGAMLFAVAVVVGGGLAWVYLEVSDRSTDSSDSTATTVTTGSWDADIQVSQVDVNGTSYASSAKLSVSWTAPSQDVSHFLIVAKDEFDQETITEIADAGEDEAVVEGLKSDTRYDVSVLACLDDDCETSLESDDSAQGSTEAEYWQIQGSGSSYGTADQIVENGSVWSYVIPYTDWAPEDLQGTIQFYYNARAMGEDGGIRVASSTDEYDFFGNSKALFFQECDMGDQKKGNAASTCPEDQLSMFAFQVIPLSSGDTRLIFEASAPADPDHITQIYSIDSDDEYVGKDFDSATDSDICGDTDTHDLIEGGDCEPELLIGSTDQGSDSGLVNARQNKVGYPIQYSWIWDESPGTYMIVTGEDECGQTRDGLFYAVFDGKDWNVQEEDGCAVPLVLDAHGPVIVHLGGDRYKVYYENYQFSSSDRSVKNVTTKPTRVLYANGGADGVVDLEDWEEEEIAREVYFLWPDGSVLDDQEEAGLGDHVIWLPQNDLEEQVMYMNLGGFDNKSWAKGSAGIGMAVLVNP